MIGINAVIDEILKFSPRILDFYEGVSEDKIKEFETQHNLVLPNDYKVFLRKSNGLNLMGTVVFGIRNDIVFLSLDASYKLEHYEVGNEMPLNLVPFSPDGAGNHYCFDSNKCDGLSCQVVFWQHDLSYSEEEPPEVVNNSFAEWAKEVLIDWTLEDYDYDGTESN